MNSHAGDAQAGKAATESVSAQDAFAEGALNAELPLRPLSVFDELMLAQDSPNYPGSIVLRIELASSLDLERLEMAAQYVARQFPLLRCSISSRGRRLFWQPNRQAHRIVDASEQAWQEIRRTSGYLNLEKDGPWRVVVRSHPESSVLYLFFHHASLDGLGAFEATSQLLVAYHELSWQKADAVVACNSHSLPRIGFWNGLKWVPKQLVGLLGVRQFLQRTPIPMVEHQPFLAEGSPPMGLQVFSQCLPVDSLEKIRLLAQAQQATVNDWLACNLFLAVQQFLQSSEHESDQRNDLRAPKVKVESNAWIRMMVPVSMREGAAGLVCNAVSSVFLDRRGEQFDDESALLTSICEEMNLIKRNRLGYMLLASLWLRRFLPGGIAIEGIPKRCPCSFVFSNVGKVLEHLPLEIRSRIREIGFVPPLAPYVVAAFSATTLGSTVQLALRTDPRVLGEEKTRKLLDLLVQQIANRIEDAPNKRKRANKENHAGETNEDRGKKGLSLWT